jgi:hypothetical protein
VLPLFLFPDIEDGVALFEKGSDTCVRMIVDKHVVVEFRIFPIPEGVTDNTSRASSSR